PLMRQVRVSTLCAHAKATRSPRLPPRINWPLMKLLASMASRRMLSCERVRKSSCLARRLPQAAAVAGKQHSQSSRFGVSADNSASALHFEARLLAFWAQESQTIEHFIFRVL